MNFSQVQPNDTSANQHDRPATSLPDLNLSTFNLWFVVVATSSLACFSILANITNSCVFLRQGLSERVNLTLLCLSAADVLAGVSALGFTTSYSGKLQPFSDFTNIDVPSLLMIFAWIRAFFIDLSSALTVYITVERCMCVTFPLTFNSSLIARKSKIILMTITLFVLANYTPILATLRSTRVNDPYRNTTILTLVYSDVHLNLGFANDLLFGIALAICCQISVFTCAVLMYLNLRRSIGVRDNRGIEQSHFPANDLKPKLNIGLPKREKRVVRMILMLACLYIPTSLPQIVFSCIRVILPDLFLKSRNIYDAIGAAVKMCTTANGAFSIFIYYHYSSKFRETISCRARELYQTSRSEISSAVNAY